MGQSEMKEGDSVYLEASACASREVDNKLRCPPTRYIPGRIKSCICVFVFVIVYLCMLWRQLRTGWEVDDKLGCLLMMMMTMMIMMMMMMMMVMRCI